MVFLVPAQDFQQLVLVLARNDVRRDAGEMDADGPVLAEFQGLRAQRLELVADAPRVGDADRAGLIVLARHEARQERVEDEPAQVQRLLELQGHGDELFPAPRRQAYAHAVAVVGQLFHAGGPRIRVGIHVARDGQDIPVFFGEEIVGLDGRLLQRDPRLDGFADHGPVLVDGLLVGRPVQHARRAGTGNPALPGPAS